MESKLSPTQQEFLRNHSIVVLSTSSEKNEPRAIFVEANKIEEDKIIITDNQMYTTKDNLLHNSQVCILVGDPEYSYFLQVR
jgi:general stress protein 26